MPFRHQHALDFAQHLVGIGGEFEHMGQHHEIEAVCRKRQRRVIGLDAYVAGAGPEAERHPVGPQEVELGHAELDRVVAEDVRHLRVEARCFPRHHVAPQRGVEPRVEAGEGFGISHWAVQE